MRKLFFIIKVNKLGMITLPKEILNLLDIEPEKTEFEFYTDRQTIILHKHKPSCFFCGNTVETLIQFKGENIFCNCISVIKNTD